jgi:hypothetical protein
MGEERKKVVRGALEGFSCESTSRKKEEGSVLTEAQTSAGE